ncbi:MAG: hypothetical protein ABH828_01575 [archaeon]
MVKKGQVSMEFLLVTGFAFLLLIPILILFLTQTQDINEDVTAAQVNKLGEELVGSVNNVYYLGEPTKKTINAYIPKYVESITFDQNRIIFNVDTGDWAYVVTKIAVANISGNLDSNAGLHTIEIIAQGNSVIIQEGS